MITNWKKEQGNWRIQKKLPEIMRRVESEDGMLGKVQEGLFMRGEVSWPRHQLSSIPNNNTWADHRSCCPDDSS